MSVHVAPHETIVIVRGAGQGLRRRFRRARIVFARMNRFRTVEPIRARRPTISCSPRSAVERR